MSCNKNNISSNCGCGGKALTTIKGYEGFEDCNSEPCSELFSDECIIHIQESISLTKNDKTISINKGERLLDILQKIMLVSLGEDNTDLSPVGVKVKKVTSNEILISYTEIKNKEINIYYKSENEDYYNFAQMNGDSYLIQNCKGETKYQIFIKNETDDKESVVVTVQTK